MNTICKANLETDLRTLESLFSKYGIENEDRDFVWQYFAKFCLYQLQQRRGVFFDAARNLLKR